MRIVRRSASRLVLRETPLKSWLMAAFCFSVGILGILMVALDSSWVGGWLFAGVGALGGVVVMLGAGAVVTLDFDRHGGTLTVKRWLFGPRVTTYPIRDLVSVEVESTTDDDGVACYRISLNTASKETITPVLDYSYGRDKHQAAGVIREFLGLRAPDDWAMLQALVKNPPGDLVGLSIEAIAEQAASLRAAISTFDASGDSEFERTERAERIRSAVSTLGADLGLSLARLGWSIQSPPGEPIVMGGPAGSIDPFRTIQALVGGELETTAWITRCRELGIAGVSLTGAMPPVSAETSVPGTQVSRQGGPEVRRPLLIQETHQPQDSLSVQCWRCKESLPVTDETRGKTTKCPRCGTRQRLPV